MVFDGLDAGDETRRNGDYVGVAHADDDGTSIDSLTVPRGRLVTHDGTSIVEVTSTAADILGVVANYDVYGDTGQEKVKGDANVKVGGTAIVDFSNFETVPSEGDFIGNNNEAVVLEASDSGADHFEVLLR